MLCPMFALNKTREICLLVETGRFFFFFETREIYEKPKNKKNGGNFKIQTKPVFFFIVQVKAPSNKSSVLICQYPKKIKEKWPQKVQLFLKKFQSHISSAPSILRYKSLDFAVFIFIFFLVPSLISVLLAFFFLFADLRIFQFAFTAFRFVSQDFKHFLSLFSLFLLFQ